MHNVIHGLCQQAILNNLWSCVGNSDTTADILGPSSGRSSSSGGMISGGSSNSSSGAVRPSVGGTDPGSGAGGSSSGETGLGGGRALPPGTDAGAAFQETTGPGAHLPNNTGGHDHRAEAPAAPGITFNADYQFDFVIGNPASPQMAPCCDAVRLQDSSVITSVHLRLCSACRH